MQLNPSIAIIDLVLTDIGKELLAKGDPGFKITKFAVADDEIDYNLYDTSQASSDNYGIYLKAMPNLEASTFAATALRNKLVTLKAGTTKIPILKVEPSSLTELYENQEVIIKPDILNYTLTEQQKSYTAILRNTNLGTLYVEKGVAGADSRPTTALASNVIASQFIATDQTERVQVVVGQTFKFVAAGDVSVIDANTRSTTIEIYGNYVGGAKSISVTVIHSEATSAKFSIQ